MPDKNVAMAPSLNLSKENHLGNYPPNDAGYATMEYQIGTCLIWVMHRDAGDRKKVIAAANGMLAAIWNDAGQALAMAVSWQASPEFWKAQDQSALSDDGLSLLSIQLFPDDGAASYEISSNPVLVLPDTLPDHPEDEIITIYRDKDGRMSSMMSG